MDELEKQQFLEHPCWQHLLERYCDRISQLRSEREASEQGPQWACRIDRMEELDELQLSSIHGELIARGWLNFQLGDRTIGLQYRVTPQGKKMLEWAHSHQNDEAAA